MWTDDRAVIWFHQLSNHHGTLSSPWKFHIWHSWCSPVTSFYFPWTWISTHNGSFNHSQFTFLWCCRSLSNIPPNQEWLWGAAEVEMTILWQVDGWFCVSASTGYSLVEGVYLKDISACPFSKFKIPHREGGLESPTLKNIRIVNKVWK